MDQRGPKRGTTIRLTETTREGLHRASFITKKSKSQIVEEALAEYFKRHNLATRYQLNVTKDQVVFQKLGTSNRIIEVAPRGNRDPEDIQAEFQSRYQEPIQLIVQAKQESGEKEES